MNLSTSAISYIARGILIALTVAAAAITVGTTAAQDASRDAGADADLPARPSDHVVLISIDGFRPDFYLDNSWPAPTIQQFATDGVKALGVRGVFPSVTYPSHTTLLTGALPIRHGIYYNSPFEPGGQTGRWYWEESLIQSETLWDAAREAGLTTASVVWPVSVGAPVDYNIPEVWYLDSEYGAIEPLRDNETPDGLLAELEREALGRLTTTNFSADYLNRDDRIGEMAAYLLETRKPNLMTVHLLGVDHFAHGEGREGLRVRKAVLAADRAVEKVREAADRAGILDRTTIIVTGDHGFVDTHTALAPNVWLTESGLMEPARDRGDWRATFFTTGGAFLHLRDRDDDAAVDEVRGILNALPSNVRKLFRIVERDELDEIGSDPNVPLALAPVRGVTTTWRADGEAVRGYGGGTHGQYPDVDDLSTGFVAWGAGVRRDVTVPQLGLEDVAPFVAALLDLDLDAPDGVVYPGMIWR